MYEGVTFARPVFLRHPVYAFKTTSRIQYPCFKRVSLLSLPTTQCWCTHVPYSLTVHNPCFKRVSLLSLPHHAMLVYTCALFTHSAQSLPMLILGSRKHVTKCQQQQKSLQKIVVDLWMRYRFWKKFVCLSVCQSVCLFVCLFVC